MGIIKKIAALFCVLMMVYSFVTPILGQENTATIKTTIMVPSVWEYSAPLINPERKGQEVTAIYKDPSVVFYNGRWHLFMSVKLGGKTAIVHCSFDKWEEAAKAPRSILKISSSAYYCAPQVFWFAPQQKWYMVYQMSVPGAKKMWVAYSTTSTIEYPDSWTQARPILDGGENDPRSEGGLDYWIICDNQWAYLFFTSLNGKLWRTRTRLEDFPEGFGRCEIALQAEIFEASHTYRIRGSDKYLTIIEQDGRRYYKAYLADRLSGPWTPLADTEQKPFAGWANIRPAANVEPWTDNVSHGELIRDGIDQTMTVDTNNLRFVFQGMLQKEKSGIPYGKYHWKIGILAPSR